MDGHYLGLPIGFEPIKLRIFVARVQAELKAQYGDQNFVNLICQLPETLEGLNQIRKNAHYRNDKIAPFLAACYALGEGLEAKSIDSDTKAVCAKLLSDRLQKARTDMHFYMRRFQIFGDLQSKLEEWREAENA